jgi:hypothetical protein
MVIRTGETISFLIAIVGYAETTFGPSS